MPIGRKEEYDHCSFLKKNRAIYMSMENAHYVETWEIDSENRLLCKVKRANRKEMTL
jgi:hypothetical protein